MNRKAKGTAAERALIHLFWGAGWAACRVAGSGAIKYPVPDVIAANNLRKLAIECKATADTSQYFNHKEITDLKEFGQRFGAETWVSVKFNREGTYFLSLDDLEPTDKHFVAHLDVAKRRGLSFEELVGKKNG